MADSRAEACLAQHARLVQVRQSYEPVWQQIDERINPTGVQFGRAAGDSGKGRQHNDKVFDATPGLALDRFKAAIHSLVTPRNQQWHGLATPDDDLSEDPEVMRYLQEVTNRLFGARYRANFDSEVQGCYGAGGKYGSFAMFIGERPGHGLYYRSVPIEQSYFAENEYGTIDLFHREWFWTARQAHARWGDKLPSVIKDAAERRPDQQFRFLHVVKPRTDADVGRLDHQGMAFVSFYIHVDTRTLVEEGGFRTFPYAVGRYDLVAGDTYGRSPCMTILPDVKMLNEMNRTTIQAAQLALLPPMLAQRDGVLDALRLTPGAINYGGVDEQGRALVQPLNMGANLPIGIEMMDQKRSVINDALLQTLFQILIDKPNITATEAMLRAQEKGQLIGPTGSRIESEFLSPMVARELDLLAAAGQLPEMPEQLAERGGAYELKFDSPLSRMREADGGVAILRTFEQLAPLAQVAGPAAFKRFNIDASAKELARLNGMPAKLLYTDEEMEQIDAQQAEQANLQQILQAAPVAASAAKDLAQANVLSSTAEGQQLPGIVPA